MPIHEYRRDRGAGFERLVRRRYAPAPVCPSCGAATARVPPTSALGGRADPGLPRERRAQRWRGTCGGSRQCPRKLRGDRERRPKLEERHPELAGGTRPVIAHEGRSHGSPLRAGDPPAKPAPLTHGHARGTERQPRKPRSAEGE